MSQTARRLSVRVVTTLYPNHADPGFAPFNRLQLKALSEIMDVEIDNLVPWRFGSKISRASSDEIVSHEYFDGLPVDHPRYATIPGLSGLNATTMAAALLSRRLRGPKPDVILGAYAYPDACAAVLLAKSWGVPVVVKCHGSDIHRVSAQPSALFQIRQLVGRADRIVVVSQELGRQAEALGLDGRKIRCVYNGVDQERFKPRDQAEARSKLGFKTKDEIVLYVGTLAEHKGAVDLAEAAARLKQLRPRARIVMVGDGPAHDLLRQAEGIELVGRKTHEEVADYVAACDLLTLPSWGEGLPNVVREAHASGRPVVATRVGGIPEAVHRAELGELVEAKDPAGLASALSRTLAKKKVAPEELVKLARLPTWNDSAEQLARVIREAAGTA